MRSKKISVVQPLTQSELSYEVQSKLDSISNKPDANTPITAGTKTKITFDENGFVTGGEDLIASDIPTITLSKISDAGTVANKNTGIGAGNIPICDANGKILIDVIPSSVTGGKTYKGVWDASTEAYPSTPTLNSGDFWDISVQGTIEGVTFNVNDELIYNGSTFDKIDNNGTISFAQDIARVGWLNLTDTEAPYLSGTEIDVVNLDDSGAGWSYYWNGQKYTFSGNKTVALTGGEGNAHDNGVHWVYIDNDTGTLKTEFGLPNITTDVIVACIFWNQSLAAGKKAQIADERHSIKWDSNIHEHAHFNFGAKLESGADISGYTLDSATDSHKQYSLTAAILDDEDLEISATPLVGGNGQYTNWYRTSEGIWGWESDKNFPFRYATSGRMIYDSATPTGTECDNGAYLNTYVLISNLVGQSRHFTVTSQATYATQALAMAETFTDLTLTGLNIPEYVVLDRITWYTSDALPGTGKCMIKNVKCLKKNIIELRSVSKITTDDIDDTIDKRYVTDAQRTVLGNTSGVNTGDETLSSIKSKLGAASGSIDGYLTNTDWSTFNGKQANLGYTPENVANIRTTFQATPDDTHYPSEKLVKDSLDAKAGTIVYGSLYEDTLAASILNMATADTYYQWVGGSVGQSSGVTASATTDNLTIVTSGIYKVNISASVAGDKSNNNIRLALFKNGTRVGSVSTIQRQPTTGLINNMAACDILSLTSGDVLDIRFLSTSNNTALSIYNVNFNVMKIG